MLDVLVPAETLDKPIKPEKCVELEMHVDINFYSSDRNYVLGRFGVLYSGTL